jgi:hypothetical protein
MSTFVKPTMSLPRLTGMLLAFATLAAHGAALSENNIDLRTTHYDMVFDDLTFANAFNHRSDLLQFHGSVGDTGSFGVVGFSAGDTISVTPGAGMSVSNLQPANGSGVVVYTASIIGTTALDLTQSWINTGTLTHGVTAGGLNYLDFFSKNSGFLRTGGLFDFFVSIPGNWSTFGTSTGQVEFLGLNPHFTISQDFVYDAASDQTTFEAIDTNYVQDSTNVHFILYGQALAVPEPTSAALLSMGVLALALGQRVRRRKRDV